jgi:hypothetical protein
MLALRAGVHDHDKSFAEAALAALNCIMLFRNRRRWFATAIAKGLILTSHVPAVAASEVSVSTTRPLSANFISAYRRLDQDNRSQLQ